MQVPNNPNRSPDRPPRRQLGPPPAGSFQNVPRGPRRVVAREASRSTRRGERTTRDRRRRRRRRARGEDDVDVDDDARARRRPFGVTD